MADERFLPGRHAIEAYGNGGFRFGDMSHRGSIIARPSGVWAWDIRPDGLGNSAFDAVLSNADDIDLMLVGTGAALVFLGEDVKWRFREAKIGLDVMTTPNAVRTYNVLVAENRRVGAALIAVD